MNHYGDKNMRNRRKYSILLTIMIMLVLISIATVILTEGLLSFILLLAQSIMLTLFYELFKSAVDKLNRNYETYESYYEHTILNKTVLKILKLQLINILKSRKIDIPSLLSYIDEYYKYLNDHVFYNDDALAKVNKCIDEYIRDFETLHYNKIKERTLKLLKDLNEINHEAEEYLYKYYLKAKKIYEH